MQFGRLFGLRLGAPVVPTITSNCILSRTEQLPVQILNWSLGCLWILTVLPLSRLCLPLDGNPWSRDILETPKGFHLGYCATIGLSPWHADVLQSKWGRV